MTVSTKRNVPKDIPNSEVGSLWGIVVYDVPTDPSGKSKNASIQLPSRLRKHAIRINLSVWVFAWAKLPDIRKIIEDKAITKDAPRIYTLRFRIDKDGEDGWKQMIVENVRDLMGKVPISFKASLEKIEGRLATLESDAAYRKMQVAFNRMKRLIEESAMALTTFAIVGDMDSLLKGTIDKVQAMFKEAEIRTTNFYVGNPVDAK